MHWIATSLRRRGVPAWVMVVLAVSGPVAWGVAGRDGRSAQARASLRVVGSLPTQLRPGLARPLELTLVNRRRFDLVVTRLVVRARVDARHRAAGCSRRDYAIRPIPRSAFPIRIARRTRVRLDALRGTSALPRMRMKNLSHRNQDACKGARLQLRYIGRVHRAK